MNLITGTDANTGQPGATMQAVGGMPARRVAVPISLFVGALYAFGFYGYTLFLLILASASLIGATRSFTMAYMALFTVLSLFVTGLALGRKRLLRPGFRFLLQVFWGLYGLRILVDGFLMPLSLRMSSWEYAARALVMTAIPMCAFAGGISPRHRKVVLFAFALPLFLSCVFVSVFYGRYIGSSYQTLSYRGVDASILFNGQDISYAGAMLLLMVTWAVSTPSRERGRPSRLLALAWVLAVVCGLICLFLGAGRGAIVAWGAGVGLVAFFQRGKSLGWRIFLILGPVLLVAVVAVTFVGHGMMERMIVLVRARQGQFDQAGDPRTYLWTLATQLFLDSPLAGTGLEIRELHAYAHNIILDAFLATGVVGGSVFIIILLVGVRAACRVMRCHPESGWVALLFVHSACRSMFSDTVYSQAFWFSLVAVVAVSQAGVRERSFLVGQDPTARRGPPGSVSVRLGFCG